MKQGLPVRIPRWWWFGLWVVVLLSAVPLVGLLFLSLWIGFLVWAFRKASPFPPLRPALTFFLVLGVVLPSGIGAGATVWVRWRSRNVRKVASNFSAMEMETRRELLKKALSSLPLKASPKEARDRLDSILGQESWLESVTLRRKNGQWVALAVMDNQKVEEIQGVASHERPESLQTPLEEVVSHESGDGGKQSPGGGD